MDFILMIVIADSIVITFIGIVLLMGYLISSAIDNK